MATLTENEKRYIIQQFAMFGTPQEIADDVSTISGKDVSRQQVHKYNPKYFKVKQTLLDLFNTTRQTFLERVKEIPIANKAYRLNELNKMLDREKRKDARMQNTKVMREVLEQSAKEVGDSYTNKQKVEQSGSVAVFSKSLDDWKADASKRSAEVKETMEMFDD